MPVQEAAARLESGLHDGLAGDALRSLTDDLLLRLDPLAYALREDPAPVMAAPASAAPEPAEISRIVEKMRRFLAGSDTSASACCDQHAAVLAWLLGDRFAGFQRLLGEYAFADAQDLLGAAVRDRAG